LRPQYLQQLRKTFLKRAVLHLTIITISIFSTSAFASSTPSAQAAPAAADWPQVQNNPQHTGFVAETIGPNFKVIWTRAFQPEKIYPQVQAIVHQGKVFVGTEMGNLYALDATTGAQAWKFAAGSPILASAAATGGKVFFAALDGSVYAINVSNGSQAWKTKIASRLGFSTAPVLADGKILLGGRNGVFYAFDPANGNKLWEYKVGAPILQTAAANNGRVFFGAMDLRVYALNTSNGSFAWKSNKLPQMAFKDYWPVVHQGKVIVRPMGSGALPSSNMSDAAQTAALAAYDANPSAAGPRSLFMFDEATGQEAPAVIHYDFITMNGAPAPPCVDRDGHLILSAPSTNQEYRTGWGRLNLSTRKIFTMLEDGTDAGNGNQDENMALTCTQNLVIALHIQEYNAQFTGVFDLTSNKWTRIEPGHTDRRLSNNTQGGGANPGSVANGILYHITWHELVARATE
jgi:hypothetical protein